MTQIVEDPIARSKAPFVMILDSLKRGYKGLSNEAKIVKNGALEIEIGSSKVYHMSQTIL